MATGGGRIDSYYARGMLEIRTTLHIVLRLVLRTNYVLEHSGAAAEGAGLLWRLALPAFVVLDLVVWRILRRDDRFGASWRLPLDSADAAFWTMSALPASGSSDLALFIAIPLAMEAGVRMGWRSMLVPAALLASTAGAGLLVGRPVSVMGFFWVALAACLGIAFFRYCRHLHARAEDERRRMLAAARRRAYLAGQNEVAMGASSAVDVIQGLVPVLGRPPPGSALARLADGWKRQLSASTAHEARYLQVALLEWERLHNAHPDLSGLVEVRVAAGQGTTLLSGPQAAQLGRLLDRMEPQGVVEIGLADPATPRLPGQELRLDVGGHILVVPADRRARPAPFDPAPVAYLYVGTLVAAWTLPVGGSVPAGPIAIGLALCLAAGIASHRRTMRHGVRARLRVYEVAVTVATSLTVLSGFATAPLTPDGLARMGFGVALTLLSFLGGFYWRSLGPWRWIVPAAVAANVALGVAVFPDPPALDVRTVLASVLYNVFPFLPCLHLDIAMQRAADRHSSFVETADESAERLAFLEGRESVVGLVRQARDDALSQLKALAPRLDPGIAALAAARLEEVERRLSTATAEHASSSSTTTG